MEEHFGVPINSVHFYVGAIEPSPEQRVSKIPHGVPPDVKITTIERGKNLSQMLADGELDAIFSATKPSSFDGKTVTHLFPNFKQVEAEYYQNTKIFPIMHVVALKRSVYDANPWVAKVLQKAFAKAMEIGYEALEERAALRYMLPWLDDNVAEARRLFGEKMYWKDGFKENRHVIEKFLEYSYKHGLANRMFKPEELFAPESLENFVV